MAATPAAAADDLPLALGVTVLLKVVTYDAGFPARGNVVGDGLFSWQHALDFVAGINAGTYNCNDTSNGGSQRTDWRLPNRSELASLLDLGQFNPVLPCGLPFTNFQSSIYWSSTTYINLLAVSGLTRIDSGDINRTALKRREIVYPDETNAQGIFLIERRNVDPEFTDDDASSLTREVVLENHCRGVSDVARKFADCAGLDKGMTNDVSLAALLHDLGEADPRFQSLLQIF